MWLLTLCRVCLQARNIAVCVEFRDSDEDDALPLKARSNLLQTSLYKPTHL